MNDLKDKPQQQILFDEINVENLTEDAPTFDEQVVIDNDMLTELEEPVDIVIEESIAGKPNWLWRIAVLLLFVLVTIETVEFFILGFAKEPLIASLYGALLFILTVITGRSLVREYIGLRQFKRRRKMQVDVNKSLMHENNAQSAQTLCKTITAQLPCDLSSKSTVSWDEQQLAELTDDEIIRLYSRKVLTTVDQKALDKVGKFSTEAVVLVALSPLAIVDMLLMVWRNFKMIDEIAHLYGLRLSYWSRIKLIKQVFVNMVYAGASELIADIGTDLLGADLLGKLSARLAQGLGAGMLTARLGLKTMQLCRPIPFENDAPKLKDVRKKLIGQIKQLVDKNN